MDNRTPKLTAVVAAAIAVVAVVALLVTTYLIGGDDTPDATDTDADSTARVEGDPAPAGAGNEPDSTDGSEDAAEDAAEDGHDHAGEEPDAGHDIEADYEPDAETEAELLDVTAGFAAAWLEPGEPDERADRISEFAIEWLANGLADVDPAALPAGELGEPTIADASELHAITRFSVGDLIVQCELVPEVEGWRVADFAPVEDPDGEGAGG